MSHVTDAELVAAHLAGDRAALASIYDRYADTLYDTAASMTRNRHDAADVMQDVFVIAAERLGQLRDPSRLKPWLFAVLRNEVYRRTGKKRRTVATDFSEPTAEMALPPEHDDPTANAEFDELASLVRGAAAGLDERDQLILELSVRQGLEGNDLADALGVSPQQCYSLLHRMRQRTERSLAAYCVARQGRKDCPELAEILHGWDGEFTVLVRKRVARHVDKCETCQSKRRVLAPFALFAGAPAFAAPAGLRDRVLGVAQSVQPVAAAGGGGAGGGGGAASYGFGAPGGFPSAIKYLHKAALWIFATVSALLLATGTTVYVLADDGSSTSAATTTTTTSAPPTTTTLPPATTPPTTSPVVLPPVDSTTTTSSTSSTTSTTTTSTTTTTTTVPPTTTTTTSPPPPTTTTTTTTTVPGSLLLSAGAIDFGTSLDTARVRLSNPGGQPISWNTTTGQLGFRGTVVSSPFSFSPAAGTLVPGGSVEIVFSFNRQWPTEGQSSQTVTFVGGGMTAPVDLTGTIARPPLITLRSFPPTSACWFAVTGVPDGLSPSINANVADESQPTLGVFEIISPVTGTRVATNTIEKGGTHSGSLSTDFDGDGIVDELGDWVWTLTITDSLGNAAAESGTMTVQSC